MSFHFKRLRLKDWLVYGGVTELSFSEIGDGQNIVTIHGQNGFGKTSLLRALEFLFHDSHNRQGYFELWHDKARETGEGSLEVDLEFKYRGTLMKLVRKLEFAPWGDTTRVSHTVMLFNNETGEAEDQARDKIELMIPQKSQQFVFFDGAEITRYARKQHDDGVREAIERMLGIPAVRNLKEDLGKLIGELEDEQAEVATLEEESTNLVGEIDRLESEQQGYLDQKENKADKLRSVDQAAKEIEKETAEIAAVESERSQLTEKKARLKDYEDRRQEKTKQIDTFLEQAPLHMLRGPLTQITQEALAQQNEGTSRHGSYAQQKRFLESLMDEADCVCGRPLTADVEERIQSEIKRLGELASRLKGSASRHWLTFMELNNLTATLQQLGSGAIDGGDVLDQRSAIDDKIEEIETDIRALERTLEDHSNADVRENTRIKNDLNDQAVDLRVGIEGLDANIARVTKGIEDKQRRLDELTAGTEEGQQITQTLRKTRALHGAVEEFVDRLVSEKREAIEQSATEIFSNITNKPQEYSGVRVKDDYTLEVYRHDGTTVENKKLSAGEKEVLAYSFITALNLSSPSPAPFVMDTPFGHLDSEHRDRLLQSLPRLEVQVFLLATDRDLPDYERDRIQHCIADEYVIERDQQNARSTIEAQ